ncbi:hypothetical protein ACIBG8_46855 [Nonomuraea sp. NPDC050556]|uniref:hypothetical protein n=1 Tax=Nonomuraea sp. NPDC050556 TaxID=3364369 RepID=UPI0037B0E313
MARRDRFPTGDGRRGYRRGRRSRYGDGYPYPRSGYYRDRITPGRVIGATLRGYSRWVAKSPDTRGLASALAALYPAGQLAHAFEPEPVWVGVLSGPLALAAWVGTYKAHHSHAYSATVAATAAAGPAWLAFATHFGAFNLPTLIGYSSASALAWSAYTWSDVLRRRRAKQAEHAKWEAMAEAAGLEESVLVAVEDTRLGHRYRVDIRRCSKTARQLASGSLSENIAAYLALPASRVRVSTDPKHAGMIQIHIQLTDPWVNTVPHPALTPTEAGASRRRRSIMDGPLILGTDPDTGHDLVVSIFDKVGGHDTFVVAPKGSGKTVLYFNLIEQATDRDDVLVWAIDLGKGTLGHVWGPALDAHAGIGEHDKAVQILEWGAAIVEERSLASGGRNHRPSPTEPIILIPIDEFDTVAGYNSPIAHKTKQPLETISRRGRSAGVQLVIAAQRGVAQYTGSKDPHANADNKIVLRVNRSAEVNNVIPNWEAEGMPDMATYAQGTAGVALVVDKDNQWCSGRVRDLHDFDAVIDLAQRRGAPTATLEPSIAAALPGYTDRHKTAVIAGAPRTAAPIHSSGRSGWGIDATDPGAVDRLARDLVADVESRLTGMPTAPDHPTPIEELLAAKDALDNGEQVPEHIARPILTLLQSRGEDGARRDEIAQALGRSLSGVSKWLAVMRDLDLIDTAGAGKAARYYLPECAPDDPTNDY